MDVPHSTARTWGPSAVGGLAVRPTSGGTERKRRVELDQINVAVPRHRIHRLPGRTRRPRGRPARWSSDPPCKQFAPRTLHVSTTVAIAARYLTLVVNELLTVGALPPSGRATELGSPYIKVGYPFHCHLAVRSSCAVAWSALSGLVCRVEGVVPRRSGVHGLPGLAALAGGTCVSGVWACGQDRGRRSGVAMRRLWQAGLAHRGDDLSGHPYTVDGVVRGRLVHDCRSGWGVGVDDAKAAGPGLLPQRGRCCTATAPR